jgi:hypothetical protein
VTLTIRLPVTVAATALVSGQPLGPLSFADPGRTISGLTWICGVWPDEPVVPDPLGVLGGVPVYVFVNQQRTHSL